MLLCANKEVATRWLYGLQPGIVIRSICVPPSAFSQELVSCEATRTKTRSIFQAREIFARRIDWIGTRHKFSKNLRKKAFAQPTLLYHLGLLVY
jgi:hypothetical protein